MKETIAIGALLRKGCQIQNNVICIEKIQLGLKMWGHLDYLTKYRAFRIARSFIDFKWLTSIKPSAPTAQGGSE